jgi:hypothetical protein
MSSAPAAPSVIALAADVEVHAEENERPKDDRKEGRDDLANTLKLAKIVVIGSDDQPGDQIRDRDEGLEAKHARVPTRNRRSLKELVRLSRVGRVRQGTVERCPTSPGVLRFAESGRRLGRKSEPPLKRIRLVAEHDAGGLVFPSLQFDPPSLMGRPVYISGDLPAPAANAKSLVFGDFKRAYAVRRVRNIGLIRYDELYSNTGQYAYRAFERVDGRHLIADAARILAHSAT